MSEGRGLRRLSLKWGGGLSHLPRLALALHLILFQKIQRVSSSTEVRDELDQAITLITLE